MITYTASDIIVQAKTLANVLNVNMPGFNLATTLLNTEYLKLYDKVAMSNGAHIREAEGVFAPFEIPEDCYHIISVRVGNMELKKSSINQNIPGTYRIENNKIVLVGYPDYYPGTLKIRYSILPQTITAPEKPRLLDVDVTMVGLVTDSGFYYKDSENVEKYYTFSNGQSEEKPFVDENTRFLDGQITLDIDNKVFYNGTDVTHIFAREDATIKSIRTSDPYVIFNYSDDRSFIFYGFEGGDQLNWNESAGKETFGEVLGFTTNNKTGRGCIWRDINGLIYYTSFTPDTVLNYPTNVFFELLIYRLAAVLASLNGVDNRYLIEELLPKAEVAFEEHLSKDNAVPIRMKNGVKYYGWI